MGRAHNAYERFRLLRAFRSGQAPGSLEPAEDVFGVVYDNGTDEGDVNTDTDERVIYDLEA